MRSFQPPPPPPPPPLLPLPALHLQRVPNAGSVRSAVLRCGPDSPARPRDLHARGAELMELQLNICVGGVRLKQDTILIYRREPFHAVPPDVRIIISR